MTSQTGYDSCGSANNANFPTRYQFTGREYDDFTELFYYRARMYDSTLGRFVSEDPIGFNGGDVNLYGYVRNNSVNYTDPLGLIDPIVYQDPSMYPDGNDVACKLGNNNPWIGGELGGNAHLVWAGGGGSAGFEVNPLTGQICGYTKVSARVGLGLFAGVGGKVNLGTGPYSQNDGTSDSVEPGLDVALIKGGKVSYKGGDFFRIPRTYPSFSGSANSNSVGVGIGPGIGLGASIGVDFVKKYTWCSSPPPECACYEKW